MLGAPLVLALHRSREALLGSSELIARQPEARYDYSLVLQAAVRFGLRLGELLGLDWGDVDLKGRVLHVRRQWTKYGELTPPKTKRGKRRVPLTDDDVSFLRGLRSDKIRQADEPVFLSRTGTRLSHRNVQRRGFEAARDLAELPETLTFHDLRHAFASIAYSLGVTLMMLSEVMGHSHVGVTQKVYIHLYGREEAEDAYRKAMSG